MSDERKYAVEIKLTSYVTRIIKGRSVAFHKTEAATYHGDCGTFKESLRIYEIGQRALENADKKKVI